LVLLYVLFALLIVSGFGQSSAVANSYLFLASSKGRGNRAAGWFADYIADQGDDQMKSIALAEGVKGWATAGGEYVQWMTEYDAKVWA
jgi:arsenical-resistance protein 2